MSECVSGEGERGGGGGGGEAGRGGGGGGVWRRSMPASQSAK